MKKNFDYQGLIGEGNPLLRYPQLLEAAIDEFSKTKFEEASLNDILKNANMSKGSLYHNFGDKFGLYLALIDIILKKKKSFFIPLLMKKQDSGDFFGTIKDLVRGTMEFMFYDERLYHMSNNYMVDNVEIKQQINQFFPTDYNGWFFVLVNSAIQSGQIDSRFSPDFIVKILEVCFSNIHKITTQDRTVEGVIGAVEQMIEMMQFGFASKKEDLYE